MFAVDRYTHDEESNRMLSDGYGNWVPYEQLKDVIEEIVDDIERLKVTDIEDVVEEIERMLKDYPNAL